MRYTYLNKPVVIREEKEGNYLLILDNAKYSLAVNETGKELYDMLQNFNDTDEIINNMSNEYPEVDKRILEKDIYEILKCFEVYGIIDIDEGKLDEYDGIKYMFTGDVNYKKVSKFIIEELNKDGWKLANPNKEYYSPIGIRLRVMQNKEQQVFAENSGKIVAYGSFFSQPVSISRVLSIQDLIFKDGLTKEEVMSYLSGMINRVLRMYSNVAKISKVRVNLYDASFDSNFIELIENMGFKETARLKEESIYGDLYIYDYIIE